MTPPKSVEQICETIQRHQLMSSKDFAAMRARWFRPDRREVADPDQFRRWLVLNRYVTEFLARVLAGRKSDQLVLNQYRLQDQMISGPMAGSYLALDALDRPVAIEVLSASSAADRAVLAGFQQAALKAITVQHPNVGRIVDVGEAHGLNYLVKEHCEGQTLDEILERRGKLPYAQATRLMALALAGLEALHSHGLPGGDLTADCLLLTPAAKDSPNQRTVKILHAGVRRRLFDETAIGRSISIAQGIPDDLQLAESCTFQVGEVGDVEPAEDIFRLGCVFYRCVTGQAPFADRDLPRPSRPAKPVAEVAPEVPEMLCQIIEQMIDPVPANRQQKAAHVAKSLRVFLAAEQGERESRAEEQIAVPSEPTRREEPEEPAEEAEDAEQEEEAPRARRSRTPAEEEGAWGKVVALWDELRPAPRDLVFVGVGALVMLALIFLAHLLTGLQITFIGGLAVGGAVSYVVERILQWRTARGAGRA